MTTLLMYTAERDLDLREQAVEELARRADERLPLFVLV
jgi:hypothetical protein